MRTAKKKLLLLIVTGFTWLQSFSQDVAASIERIDRQLKTGETSLSKILGDEQLMALHPVTAFREMIRAHARPGNLSIVSQREPGTRIMVKGVVQDKQKKPLPNVLIYFYQTSSAGWYSDTGVHILVNSGDFKHARLFGYLKTDAQGAFGFETIKPSGYPKSDLAAHIHIHLSDANGKSLHATGELQFDDDPRMTPARRTRSEQEGFLIATNSGTTSFPVYEYILITK